MHKHKASVALLTVWLLGVVLVFALGPADPISCFLLAGTFSVLWGVSMAILSMNPSGTWWQSELARTGPFAAVHRRSTYVRLSSLTEFGLKRCGG